MSIKKKKKSHSIQKMGKCSPFKDGKQQQQQQRLYLKWSDGGLLNDFKTSVLKTIKELEKVVENILKWYIESENHLYSIQLFGPSHPWNSLGQNAGVGSLSLLQWILPNPGIKQGSPALQTNSLPTELSGKTKKWYINKMDISIKI